MVGIYCRVSTKGQEKDGYSLDTQEEAGRAWANGKGECIVYREAASGKQLEKREEWKRLETDVKDNLITKVWVIDGDRLARKQLDSLLMIKFLEEHGVELNVNGRKIAFDDPDDIMVFQIRQAIAEHVGADIIRKSVRGIRKSLDNGTKATARLYGYKREFSPDGSIRWVIVPEQAEAIKRTFELFLQGMSLQKITRTLNREGHRSWNGGYFYNSKIHRGLSQPKYTGLSYDTQRRLIDSKVYEPIIDRESWKQAQQLLKLNAQDPTRNFRKKADHISTGILRCGKCGEPFHFHARGGRNGRRGYYDHLRTGVLTCGQKPTEIRDYFLDTLFSGLYMMTIQDRASVKSLYTAEQEKLSTEKHRINRDIERIDRRIEELSIEKKRLIRFIRKGAIDEIDVVADMNEINAEQQTLTASRTHLSKSIRQSQDQLESLLAKYGAENFSRFAEGTAMLKREMLRSMIEFAAITDREIVVRMITSQEYRIEYPSARVTSELKLWERDQVCVFSYLESIESNFSSSETFNEAFYDVLNILEGQASVSPK